MTRATAPVALGGSGGAMRASGFEHCSLPHEARVAERLRMRSKKELLTEKRKPNWLAVSSFPEPTPLTDLVGLALLCDFQLWGSTG